MKRYFLSLVALAGMLFATSCQESMIEPQVDGTTTFSVQLPEQMGTKSYGDANFTNATINTLYVEVYDKDSNKKLHTPAPVEVKDGKANISLNLIQNQEYDIIFWAQKGDAYETDDLTTMEMNANHHNVERGAAFYAVLDNFKPVNGNQPVELRRPFAQLNLGTRLGTSYGDVSLVSSKIEVTGVATHFNTVGEACTTTTTFTYENEDQKCPYVTVLNVGGEDFAYVSMDYLAVPGTQSALVKVKATIKVKDSKNKETELVREFESVPVQKNYRTNIVGNLVTSSTDFNVTINEGWAGTNDKEVEFREVATAEELQKAIEEGVDNITLVDDIELTGTLVFGSAPTPGQGSIARASESVEDEDFVLDLNGKTITTAWENEAAGKHYYAFTNYANLVVKNGTINARGTFNYGTLTIEDGTTINAIDANGGYGVRNYEGAEFIMNGGVIATTNEDGDEPTKGYDATTLRVDANAKATINAGKISNISNYTFAIDNAGEVIVNAGIISSVHSTVSSYGNLTINGGSFTCNGLEGVTAHALVVWDGSETTINGGEFDGKDNYNGFNVCADEGSVVNITGGKFHSVHSGSLYGKGTITVSGGIFFDEIATERLAEGYCILPYTQGYYSVVAESNIVTTEEQLKACVERGGEIVLNADIALSSTLIIEEGADVSINLNKYTISGSWPKTDGHIINNNGNLVLLNGTVSSQGANGGSAVYNAGKITIEEMILNGASVRENGGWPAYPINNYGDMILTSTTIVGYQGAVACSGPGTTIVNSCELNKMYLNTSSHTFYIINGANVVVNSGVYTHKGMDGSLAYVSNGIFTVNGGEFTAEAGGYGIASLTNGEVIINGGTFNNAFQDWGGSISVLGGRFKNNPSKWLAEGFVADKVDDVWVVSSANVKIEGNVYSSLQKAVNDAKDGQTITLLNDIEQADGVLITDKNITIDLNGKTYTVTEGASTNNRNFKINGSSIVTIKNGTMIAEGELTSGAYGTVRAEGDAVVNLEAVKLYSYRGYGLNVKANTGTKVNIKDSEIYSQYSGGVEAAGGTIELTNVKIDQEGVYSAAAWCSVAIGVNGGGKVVVNSGEYNAATIKTDANAAQGTWVAYVMSSGGTLDINGGTFNATVAETASAANACGAICADRAAVVNINGGIFNSNGAILDMRNNVGTQPNPVATLAGGNFSADPRVSGLYGSNLIQVEEGYGVVQNEDGRYSVEVAQQNQ